MGRSLWNNLLQPVGRKATDWRKDVPFLCPSKTRPYLATRLNSAHQVDGDACLVPHELPLSPEADQDLLPGSGLVVPPHIWSCHRQLPPLAAQLWSLMSDPSNL